MTAPRPTPEQHAARLAAELRRRQQESADSGVDRVTAWLQGVRDGANPADGAQMWIGL